MLQNLSIGYPEFQNNPYSSKTVIHHTTTTVFGIFLISNSLVVGSVGEGLNGLKDRQILLPGFLCMVVHQRYCVPGESTKFTGTNIRHKIVAAVERIILFPFQIQTNQSFLNPVAFLTGSILFRNKPSIRNKDKLISHANISLPELLIVMTN